MLTNTLFAVVASVQDYQNTSLTCQLSKCNHFIGLCSKLVGNPKQCYQILLCTTPPSPNEPGLKRCTVDNSMEVSQTGL